MSQSPKFLLRCRKCGHAIADFKTWFAHNQACPQCGHKFVYAEYAADAARIKDLIEDQNYTAPDFWRYFDFLPLVDRANIVTSGEGAIPVDRWPFLERFAAQNYGLDIEVHAYRNDLNMGTGTFKDVAASMAASALKENGIKEYAVASTGNIANAFAHYLAKAGVSLSVFIPADALEANEAEASSYGQRVFRVRGDYSQAKAVAAAFNQRHGILLSGGNTDPLRVEAKRTMVFEWRRLMRRMPTVYIQALSGGTGPIAIEKAYHDLRGTALDGPMPRFLMVQPDQCDPMAQGFQQAKRDGFPRGWESRYPVMDNPRTAVPTLATGNPATYPIVAELTKRSGGEIFSAPESQITHTARMVAYETHNRIGPASCVAVGGFFEALDRGLLRDGDVALVNIGEGTRRAPGLLTDMIYSSRQVSGIDDCDRFDREQYRKELWAPFAKYHKR